MKGHFQSIVGWEKFAEQWLLRMKLAEQQLKPVWPGTPGVERPGGERCLLAEEVLTIGDVTRAVTDAAFRTKSDYSESDIKLLWHALSRYPGNNRGRKASKPQLDGPVA